MSKQVSWQSRRGIAWRSLAGAACALAGVLAFELACRTWGWRLASPAEVPMLAALLGGLLWGIAGGLGAGAVVAGFVLVALNWPERFAGLDAPLVLAVSLTLPLLAGALAGGIRDQFERLNARMLAVVEGRLRQAEDRYRTLVHSLPDAIISCIGGRLDYANPAFVRLMGGEDAPTFIGRQLSEFFRAQPKSGEHGQADVESATLIAADGSLRHVESIWFTQEEGGRAVVHGVLRDVSGRARREEAVRASEARFKSLTALSSDWYWRQDEQFRFVTAGTDANDEPSRLSIAAVGNTRWDNPSADLSQAQWQAHKAVLEAGQPFRDLQYSRLGMDGKRHWVSISGAPLFDSDGRLAGYHGIGRDITERKQAERTQDLEHSIARALAAAESAPAALQAVIRAVCESQDWAWGRYWRLDERSGALRADEIWARPDAGVEAQRPARADADLAADALLAGQVLASGEPLWIGDLRSDARVSQQAFAFDGSPHGALLLPVISDARTIGVLSFFAPLVDAPAARFLQALRGIGSQLGQFMRRMRAEEELLRFRVALDHSADMILLIDRATMRYVDVNDTVCSLLGYTREEMVSRGPQDVLPVSQARLEEDYDKLIADTGTPGKLRSYYLCKDGSRLPFESSRHVIRSGAGHLIAAISRDIRERLAAEEGLRESEARFRSLVALSSDWFWEQDEHYRYLPLTDESIGKEDLQPPDFVGKTRWEVSERTLGEAGWAAHRAMLERRESFHDLEYQGLNHKGETRWVSVSGMPIFDKDGRFRGYRGVGRDITARKQAELAQAEQLVFVTEVIDAIPQPVYFKDIQGRYVGLNRAFEKLFGVRREDVLGKAASFLAPALDAEFHEAQDARALGRSGLVEYEADIRAADGTLRRTLQHKTVYRHADGSPRGTLGVITDMTERVAAARALAESEAGFRAIFERSNAGITLWTADGRYLAVNEAQARFLGYTREEILERSIADVRSPADADWEDTLRQLLSGQREHYTRDRRYARKDGSEVWGRLSVAPVRDAEGQIQYFVTITTDITEAREASSRIERMNAMLEARVRERTAELEALVRELESFSYTISHDLRAPLRAMSGFAEILLQKQGEGLSQEVRRMLGRIRANAGRMAELLDGLLAFSRLGRRSMSRSAVPMRELAGKAWADLANELVGREVEFQLGVVPACEGDAVLLEQVWANLLSNAAKYTRGRDPACIAAGWDPQQQAYFVRDNGAGFDMQYADKLFGVFSRLHGDEEFEGTGLGLAICERILHRHGGRIRGEARPGEGAAFYFSVGSEAAPR